MSKLYENAVFIPGGKRSMAAVTVLVVIVLVTGISILAWLSQLNVLKKLAEGKEVSESAMNLNDAAFSCSGCSLGLLNIACAILFCMWFHRAYKNLYALKAYPLNYSPGMAVASFFMPFVNVILPYRVAREIWWESSSKPADRTQKKSKDQPMIATWWVLFIISSNGGAVVASFMTKASSVDQLQKATALALVADLLSLWAAIAAIAVIIGIDNRQKRRHNELAEDGEG